MTPPEFDGMVLMDLDLPECKFMETDVDPGTSMPFSIVFYTRQAEEDNQSLGQFVQSIPKRNIGWDKPTRQLFYRGMTNKLYKLNFEEVV
jgi:hypothetical protein